jgi:nitrogen fixation NifU-like protein
MSHPDAISDDLYREIILDHYTCPRHKGHLETATHRLEGVNPSCGDMVELDLEVRDGRVVEVGFVGEGCSISMASASMLAESVRGQTLDQVRLLADTFKARLLTKAGIPEPPEGVEIGELEALDGVRAYPVRIKCALLAWNTLLEAIENER